MFAEPSTFGLRFRGVEEFEIGLGNDPRALSVHVGVNHRDRRLRPDARGTGIDNLQLALGLLKFQVGFVFPGQVDVADPVLGCMSLRDARNKQPDRTWIGCG